MMSTSHNHPGHQQLASTEHSFVHCVVTQCFQGTESGFGLSFCKRSCDAFKGIRRRGIDLWDQKTVRRRSLGREVGPGPKRESVSIWGDQQRFSEPERFRLSEFGTPGDGSYLRSRSTCCWEDRPHMGPIEMDASTSDRAIDRRWVFLAPVWATGKPAQRCRSDTRYNQGGLVRRDSPGWVTTRPHVCFASL